MSVPTHLHQQAIIRSCLSTPSSGKQPKSGFPIQNLGVATAHDEPLKEQHFDSCEPFAIHGCLRGVPTRLQQQRSCPKTPEGSRTISAANIVPPPGDLATPRLTEATPELKDGVIT